MSEQPLKVEGPAIEEENKAAQMAALKQMADAWEQRMDDQMAELHNRFVGFISEARLPIPQVLVVLELLVKETLDQAYQSYLGG